MRQSPKSNSSPNAEAIMDSIQYTIDRAATRRQFLGRAVNGIGSLALASLLNPELFANGSSKSAASRGVLPGFDFAPKAKRVIFLFQSGGPSQFELFQNRPKLTQMHGEPMPESLTKGQRLAQIRGQKLRICGTPYAFKRHGQSGAEVSELLPHTARIVDDICIIRTAVTDPINHDPAITFMQTGG